eukprot:CAMPEP_0185756610 /NCGR_PEP_ID=MMETSP1174-20130828/15027_1 /TAXON_ID=35687 /ORGANISM="Dictyocha speculum, Strain CCMP1381" /LENGTH=58 /DNA_ID=CAMNT_0028435639 /DNA_START=511 /DNA_END=687 /DNA_ORIENTATION=-
MNVRVNNDPTAVLIVITECYGCHEMGYLCSNSMDRHQFFVFRWHGPVKLLNKQRCRTL